MPQSKEVHRNYIQTYRQEHLDYDKRERDGVKQEVLTHYGDGKCACVQCGEARMACLSIDHINGNGAAHRRATGIGSQNIYRWLRLHSFPLGYQTLCMNCQWEKRSERREYGGSNNGIEGV